MRTTARRTSVPLLALVCVTLAAVAPDVLSQQLEEIVVTAQKRTERLQDVALTVQVLGGDWIDKQGLGDVEVFSENMPAVNISRSANNQRINIRGIGSGTNEGFEQSVGIFFDGIYYGQGRHLRPKLFDVARIELLKGPQSTLFGTNVTAGALNIVTNDPTETFEGSVELLLGEDGEQEGNVVLSGPLSKKVLGRVAAYKRDFDGYVDNLTANTAFPLEDNWGGRVVLMFNVNDKLSIRTIYEHQDLQTVGNVAQNIYDPSVATFLAPIVGDSGEFDYTNVGGVQSGYTSIPNGRIHDDNTFDTASLKLIYDGGDYTITSITGYTKYDWFNFVDSDYSALNIFSMLTDIKFDQVSEELRFESSLGDNIEYVAGIYYHNQDLNRGKISEAQIASLPVNLIVTSPAVQEATTWAVFGQFTYSFSDHVRSSLGLRYSSEDKKVHDVLTFNLPIPTFFGARPHDIRDDRQEEHVSWLVRGEYDISDNAMLYALGSTGFKGGGFDIGQGLGSSQGSVPAPNFQFTEEKATSIEVGLKTTIFDGSGLFNLSAFRTKYEDLQVTQFIGNGFYVGNASEATVQGLELDYLHALTDNLTLQLTASYLDFEFDSFPGAPCTLRQRAGLDSGCDTSVTANGVQDLRGGVGEFAPELSANANLDFKHSLSDQLVFKVNLNVVYSDDYFTQLGMDPNARQDSYTKLNARIGFAAADDKWEVAILGKNLTDERVSANSFDSGLSGLLAPGTVLPTYVTFITRSRSLALQAVYRF